ncbi:hypothetical protein B0H14DRAFT_3641410 [Mycena olivaceomarginata]|nr:hypothetical protein B0H14DRAFT_3641410 [Mycena olivaceomarginata]
MATQLPPRFTEIKRAIASGSPNFEQDLIKALKEVLDQVDEVTQTIAKEGAAYIPQVSFTDLDKLSETQIAEIKRKGTVVIKDVVDDAQARAWKTSLEEFVKANPQSDGFPEDNKQFFHYWMKAQVQARAHPNMLGVSTWVNSLYHSTSGQKVEGVDLAMPLSYADRFRIRHPGSPWHRHPPHIDDEKFRTCFADIVSGQWTKHDPYALETRLEALTSLYRKPNYSTSSVFRTFQGWLALRFSFFYGTLKVFPDVLLSNAYIILRPFFRPLILDAANWTFDISTPDFSGIIRLDGGFGGPKSTSELHPHLLLDATMTSVPAVNPGDTVFWHCDVVHSVEEEHTQTFPIGLPKRLAPQSGV